jgi:hypothetical protein
VPPFNCFTRDHVFVAIKMCPGTEEGGMPRICGLKGYSIYGDIDVGLLWRRSRNGSQLDIFTVSVLLDIAGARDHN